MQQITLKIGAICTTPIEAAEVKLASSLDLSAQEHYSLSRLNNLFPAADLILGGFANLVQVRRMGGWMALSSRGSSGTGGPALSPLKKVLTGFCLDPSR